MAGILVILCMVAALMAVAYSENLEWKKHHHHKHHHHHHHGKQTLADVPDSWDWRTHNAVSPVVNQGERDNTFALDVADSVNSLHYIQTGYPVTTSAQELNDCCTANPASSDIYNCIVAPPLQGLCDENQYNPRPGGHCNAITCYSVTPEIKGGYAVVSKNETDLKLSVYKNPAVVLIDASQPSFQTYRSDVYDEPNCSSDELDHVLLVVGYGQIDGVDVWICKNTWGADWGVQGYIYIARGKNTCGIATNAMIPI